MAQVLIDKVRKVYPNGTEALTPSTLSIRDGEFIVLVGPSGCGKSTLLRMVAGLEDITEGAISIGERVVNDLDPAERDIAMVFQNYALYPHMSVYKNMAYGLKNRGRSKEDIDVAVQKAAKLLHIEEFLERRPSQLSGGQRQRVAMGRAIVRDPALFLFDEPLSNLDAKLRNQMRIEIRKLQRELGVTSIYVTHDQIEAMTMADRIAVLNTGKIEQIGTPSEIYHTPASIFVAGFMGAPPMNILDGHYNGNGGLEIKDLGHVAVTISCLCQATSASASVRKMSRSTRTRWKTPCRSRSISSRNWAPVGCCTPPSARRRSSPISTTSIRSTATGSSPTCRLAHCIFSTPRRGGASDQPPARRSAQLDTLAQLNRRISHAIGGIEQHFERLKRLLDQRQRCVSMGGCDGGSQRAMRYPGRRAVKFVTQLGVYAVVNGPVQAFQVPSVSRLCPENQRR